MTSLADRPLKVSPMAEENQSPSLIQLPPRTAPRFHLYTTDNSGNSISLHPWGDFFIDLGCRVAQASINSENRLTTAVAIPTRFCAAALTALGVVTTRATLNSQGNNSEHFQKLCKLKQGTPLTYIYQGRKNKAFYEGFDNSCGRLKIRVESRQSGGLTHLVSSEEAHNIRIRITPINQLPKKQQGRKIISYSSFLEEMIGKEQATKYSTTSEFECLIIGKHHALKSEITEIPFSSCKTQKAGHLQDILRVRSFFSTQDEAYHSEVFSSRHLQKLASNPCSTGGKSGLLEMSSSSRNPLIHIDGQMPFVTIFDGASDFISGEKYSSSHRIILLDRTEIDFQEAVNIINQDYISRVTEDQIIQSHLIPSGVEIMSYQEEKL